MNLILTMAGKYKRFQDAGFNIPKYLLPWGDSTILSAVLRGFSKSRQIKNIYLIGNKRDHAFTPHIHALLRSCGIGTGNLFLINDTHGQAATGMIGLDLIANVDKGVMSEPILFHNIDTLLTNRNFEDILESLSKSAAYVDVFHANHHQYSYVVCNENNDVTELAEKIVISNCASSGLYAFQSGETYKNYYKNCDIYISDVIRKILKDGKRVKASNPHSEHDTIVLGTPSEYFNQAIVSNFL
ncbi:sugar phosphate nucleotidyltransferase [Polynucleobacter sp. Adler-ghost]|uniref:sugar phosphate nucleotidyltransferase n=1 Tax=Polynucleobacter sp. Adler-ghost TaxID=2770234 RepID=UPI001BFD58B5|nr:sugar phosphate nucleotidyltransferase [Polynucleobacter sp. Adler-ghost]QWE31048.1 hypothetical protein ICV89_01630 [Polynucleobacter sp. Adler-ghost]